MINSAKVKASGQIVMFEHDQPRERSAPMPILPLMLAYAYDPAGRSELEGPIMLGKRS